MSDVEVWWNEDHLTNIRFEHDEHGWAIAVGDGLYRLVNTPLRGWSDRAEPDLPQWGDLVRLRPQNGEESWLEIVEKYQEPIA